mmetsp:Transcript_21402/g.42858  ORF Transcript_21402/g.42858 Transcript_21402/m.42858 type:complete len:478 (-) Transcript_21402:51-1484(-)
MGKLYRMIFGRKARAKAKAEARAEARAEFRAKAKAEAEAEAEAELARRRATLMKYYASVSPVSAGSCRTSELHGGVTFVVEPNIASAGPGSYGKNKNRHREVGKSDTLAKAWEKMATAQGSVEAMSPAPAQTVEVFTKQNLFVKSVHAAFFGHHPLVLSPDVVWQTIAQGLANHVDQHAEALRDKFVSHEGKEDITIERGEFTKGSQDNDWPGVFPEFCEKIADKCVAGTVELIQSDFTTTGPVEKICSCITVMDTVQHYFRYSIMCGCGFPEITLTGTPEDWEKISAKAEGLRKYELDWWLDDLLPVLDQFVAAAHGKPDLDFWRSLCFLNTGTSWPIYEPLTGWVNAFFPYLIEDGRDFDAFAETADGTAKKSLKKNPYMANYVASALSKTNVENSPFTSGEWALPQGVERGVELELFPPAMSSAPFLYKDLLTETEYKMAFFGGISCLVQHEQDGAIEPKMSWAVLDSGESKKL